MPHHCLQLLLARCIQAILGEERKKHQFLLFNTLPSIWIILLMESSYSLKFCIGNCWMSVSFPLQMHGDTGWTKRASLLGNLLFFLYFAFKWLCCSAAWNVSSSWLKMLSLPGDRHTCISLELRTCDGWDAAGMLSCFSTAGIQNVSCAFWRSLAWRSFSKRIEMVRGGHLRRAYGNYCMDFFLILWGRKSIVATVELSSSCFFHTGFMEQRSSSAGCSAPLPLLARALHLRAYLVCLCGN